MSHVLLEYPRLASLPEDLIRVFARYAIPELVLPEGVPKQSLVDSIVNAARPPLTLRYMQARLGYPQCLQQLVGLFITQLSLMAASQSKQFIFQDHAGHVSIVSIRKNTEGLYRVFVVDSLSVFKRYYEDQVYSLLAHFVTLALTLALRHHGFTDSRFYFLPERQGSGFGCESFMLHDLETLLEFPMLAGNGYYADKDPLTNDNMVQFFLHITYGLDDEQLGRLRVNGEIKSFVGTSDKPALYTNDLNTLIVTAIQTWNVLGVEPGLFKFYQLRRFPPRFAHLTQGQQRLNRLLEKFPEERQKEVDKVVDETRGLL
ncbi:hypothetical protein, partial [Endozoicomonas sp. ONNA1]